MEKVVQVDCDALIIGRNGSFEIESIALLENSRHEISIVGISKAKKMIVRAGIHRIDPADLDTLAFAWIQLRHRRLTAAITEYKLNLP